MISHVYWEEIVGLDSLNEAVETFTSKLTSIAKQCMPSKIIKVRENDAPWMTEDIKKTHGEKTKSSQFC